jgi:outer membrane protein assembly factor BamC
VRIDFGRAWSQLSQAIENAEIEITESNRDEAFYTVRFDGQVEEERPGFFRRLFGAGRKPEGEMPAFRLNIATEADRVVITAVPEDGAAGATLELRNLLIRAVHRNLI